MNTEYEDSIDLQGSRFAYLTGLNIVNNAIMSLISLKNYKGIFVYYFA